MALNSLGNKRRGDDSADVQPRWRRLTRLIVSLLAFALLLASATCAYRIYAGNAAVNHAILTQAVPLNSRQRILVISPHPDDESLGTAGLLQNAIEDGAAVKVVFMTSGDAFRFGVARYYNKLEVAPPDFLRYGEMRMGESRAALSQLGLKPGQVTFFGYPDRGMMAMWREHWNASDPFRSPYSEATSVFYPGVYHPGATFCGNSVLTDLEMLMRQYQPTDVYVTHPNDDHDDHSATSAFTTLAVESLRRSGEPWARNLRIHYYLVHRGDWPVPQGLHTALALAPPARLMNCDTDWTTLPLTIAQEKAKLAAINSYTSQESMMGRFLTSFVRTNEVFGDIPAQTATLDTERAGAYTIDGSSVTWPGGRPVSIDPTGDNVLLSLQKGADIKMLAAYQDGNDLYIRMDANGDLLSTVRYVLHVRVVDFAGHSTPRETALTLSPRAVPDSHVATLTNNEAVAWHDNTLEARVPLAQLNCPRDGMLFIEGVTHFSALPFDRTGPRAVIVHLGGADPSVASR